MLVSLLFGFLSLHIPVKRGALLTHVTSGFPLLRRAETKLQVSTGAQPKCNQRNCMFAASHQRQELISGM